MDAGASQSEETSDEATQTTIDFDIFYWVLII